MRYVFSIVVLIIAAGLARGQSTSPNAFTVSHKEIKAGGARFSITIGKSTPSVVIKEKNKIISSGYTGIEQENTPEKNTLTGKSTVSIYPNPASDYLQFKFKSRQSVNYVKVAIYDLTGRKLKSWDNLRVQGYFLTKKLSIANLEEGSYVIRCFDQKNRTLSAHKFVKKR